MADLRWLPIPCLNGLIGAFAAGYDANGNMTYRVRYGEGAIEFAYDVENRLTQASHMGVAQASFVYGGDGNRVKATFGSTTTVYVGNIYERDNDSTVRKYY